MGISRYLIEEKRQAGRRYVLRKGKGKISRGLAALISLERPPAAALI